MSNTVCISKNMAIQICLIGLLLVVLSGCAQQNKTVDLYVDAQALSNSGENEQAIEKLNRATEIDGQFALAYSLLGDIHQKTDNYDMSVWAYRKAIELNPWSAKDYLGLGGLYQNNAEFKRAIAVYSKAADVEPQNFDVHYRTAVCYYEMKDYQSAEQAALQAELVDRDSTAAQVLLGDLYFIMNNNEQAQLAYERVLEISPNRVDVMTSLARVHLRNQEYDRAGKLLTSAIRINPTHTTSFVYLGFYYLKLNDVGRAIESYETAVAIDMNDYKAHRGLGMAYMIKALADDDEPLKVQAVEHWKRSLEIAPNQDNNQKLLRLIKKYSQ